MSINQLFFVDFINKNLNFIKGQRINKILQVTKSDFYFMLIPLRKYLHISLNSPSPFINIEDNFDFMKLSSTNTLQNLKKQLSDARLLDASVLNNDKIISISFKKTYENYEINEGQFIIECITNHPNFYILNKDKKIIYAYRYTTLDAPRVIMQGINYSLPNVFKNTAEPQLNAKDYQCINNYNSSLIEQIKKENYGFAIKKVNQEIKHLNKKIYILTNILSDNSNANFYKNAGDYIFCNLDKDFTSVSIDGTTVSLNPLLSKEQNASKFFKKYKKMKEGFKLNQEFLNKAKDSLQYFENIQFQIEKAAIEDLDEIVDELESIGLLPKRIKSKKVIKSIMPYSIVFNNVKIAFGKNNIQNNTLTFSLAKSDYYFLHVKDYKGSHVVIFSNSPSKEVIQKACEIALYLSKLSTGDIMLADVKDVKKTSISGLVNILKYETIHISSYDESTIEQMISSTSR